jgi:hypothetical protein
VHPIPQDGFFKKINLPNLIGLKPFNVTILQVVHEDYYSLLDKKQVYLMAAHKQ